MSLAQQQQVTVSLERMSCTPCGFAFWAPDWFYRKRRNDGSSWHCPACGVSLVFTDNEKTKLEREKAALERRLGWAQDDAKRQREVRERTERRLSATRGVLTKVRKRVGHGVCPVVGCQRHFENLQRHMKSEHPSYQPEAEVG